MSLKNGGFRFAFPMRTGLHHGIGRPLAEVKGLSWRAPDGGIRHNPERELIHDMDSLP